MAILETPGGRGFGRVGQRTMAVFALIALCGGSGAAASEPASALTIRLVRPDHQLEQVLALFEGTRSTSPAAALADWKHANPNSQRVSKPLGAAIAAFNPKMVRELRSFDGACVGLGLDPGKGHTRWYLVAPGDDGSLAAFIPALTLTGGTSVEPFRGLPVDRLGPPGAPVSARLPNVFVVARSPEDLPAAFRFADAGAAKGLPLQSGSRIVLDPSALPANGSMTVRRLVEAVRAVNCQDAEAALSVEGETFTLAVEGRFAAVSRHAEPLEPGWLNGVPATGTMAAWAWALDPSPDAWNRFYSIADRIERVDPARTKAAPIRVRVGLLASAAGVRSDLPIVERLRGVSGFIQGDSRGNVVGAVVALHATDKADANRLATNFFPRIAALITGEKNPASPPGTIRRLGNVGGRPLSVSQEGTTVLVGWGESAVTAWLNAERDPERSAGPLIRGFWGPEIPHRGGAVWPGMLGEEMLVGAPPIVWWGRDDASRTYDVVRWRELRGVVRRFLERLPMDPPPDR